MYKNPQWYKIRKKNKNKYVVKIKTKFNLAF